MGGLTKSQEVLVSAGALSLVCLTAASPWRLVVQGDILYPDATILNEVGKIRHLALLWAPLQCHRKAPEHSGT